VIYGSDILTSAYPIEKTIDRVREEISKLKLKITDVEKIIQISDLDGCYITDNQIFEKMIPQTIYLDNTIECPDKKHLMNRNSTKRVNINMLNTRKEIAFGKHNVSYEIY